MMVTDMLNVLWNVQNQYNSCAEGICSIQSQLSSRGIMCLLYSCHMVLYVHWVNICVYCIPVTWHYLFIVFMSCGIELIVSTYVPTVFMSHGAMCSLYQHMCLLYSCHMALSVHCIHVMWYWAHCTHICTHCIHVTWYYVFIVFMYPLYSCHMALCVHCINICVYCIHVPTVLMSHGTMCSLYQHMCPLYSCH